MAPAVPGFPPHPLGMSPLLECPPAARCPWLPWELLFLWWEEHQEAASFLCHKNSLAPLKFFEGQRQYPRGVTGCTVGVVTAQGQGVQEKVGVPRRGVWAVWQTDAVDSSQVDASLGA